ncbi:MAG: hypothetical protein LUC95_12870 [Lachnospiraceae bacterium]|nr:hypothetical protein [Lachnospiraceae bacterium]
MTKRLSVFIKAYLSAFALTVTFQAPLQAADYEGKLDFIIASVYERLGEYQFRLLLVVGLIAFVYWYMEKQGCAERERGFSLLASFFGKEYDGYALFNCGNRDFGSLWCSACFCGSRLEA